MKNSNVSQATSTTNADVCAGNYLYIIIIHTQFDQFSVVTLLSLYFTVPTIYQICKCYREIFLHFYLKFNSSYTNGIDVVVQTYTCYIGIKYVYSPAVFMRYIYIISIPRLRYANIVEVCPHDCYYIHCVPRPVTSGYNSYITRSCCSQSRARQPTTTTAVRFCDCVGIINLRNFSYHNFRRLSCVR